MVLNQTMFMDPLFENFDGKNASFLVIYAVVTLMMLIYGCSEFSLR